jgi:hypothetical protein
MRNKLETTKHLSDQLNSHKCIKSRLLSFFYKMKPTDVYTTNAWCATSLESRTRNITSQIRPVAIGFGRKLFHIHAGFLHFKRKTVYFY